jgi:hypothetical protein
VLGAHKAALQQEAREELKVPNQLPVLADKEELLLMLVEHKIGKLDQTLLQIYFVVLLWVVLLVLLWIHLGEMAQLQQLVHGF